MNDSSSDQEMRRHKGASTSYVREVSHDRSMCPYCGLIVDSVETATRLAIPHSAWGWGVAPDSRWRCRFVRLCGSATQGARGGNIIMGKHQSHPSIDVRPQSAARTSRRPQKIQRPKITPQPTRAPALCVGPTAALPQCFGAVQAAERAPPPVQHRFRLSSSSPAPSGRSPHFLIRLLDCPSPTLAPGKFCA